MPPYTGEDVGAVRQRRPRPDASKLEARDAWIGDLDLDAFKNDVKALEQKLKNETGPADSAHLKKIVFWCNLCAATGLALSWLPVWTIFPALCLSIGTFARWTMVGHHTSHGGYERNKDVVAEGYSRWKFGVGGLYRRVMDWFDWMLPEAWDFEHNHCHHYALNEMADPDLVQKNLSGLRSTNIPKPLKYAVVGVFMATWKWLYYSPNTFFKLHEKALRKKGITIEAKPGRQLYEPQTLFYVLTNPPCRDEFFPLTKKLELLWHVVGPYFLYRFLLLPFGVYAATQALGFGSTSVFWNAMANMIIAELVTNIHSFIVIVTNHCGYDMYTYEKHCDANSGTFYLRAIISSANFHGGNDLLDFSQGWLNYQVEHHMWPQMSMLKYQQAAPQVREICKKHGVPYISENVFLRLKKTVDVMVGNTTCRPYPLEWECLDHDVVPDSIPVTDSNLHKWQ